MESSMLKLRPAPFVLAVVCFLMPFVTLSCMGLSQSFSGTEVAFGTTVEGKKLNGQPLAALALGLAGVGIFLSFKQTQNAKKAATAAGGLGAILLLLLQSQINTEAGRQGPVQVTFELAYWLAVIGLGGGAWLSVAALKVPEAESANLHKANPEMVPAPGESAEARTPDQE